MYPTVMLMLALDERDQATVEAFLGLAPRLGVQRLTVVHLQQVDLLPAAIARSLPTASPGPSPELSARVDALRAALPDVAVDVELGGGEPIEALDQLQQRLQPDLLVIGRSPLDDDDDAWGEIGRNAMRHARTSTLVVPHGWRGPARGAVVGVDFSAHSALALKTALQLYDDVVCLYQYDPRHRHAGSMTEVQFSLALAGNARESFEQDLLPQLGGRTPPLEVVGTRRASDAIVARADGDRMIVIGSRGLSPFAALLLGSTAERIAGRAAAPVLIVRIKGEEMGLVEGIIRR